MNIIDSELIKMIKKKSNSELTKEIKRLKAKNKEILESIEIIKKESDRVMEENEKLRECVNYYAAEGNWSQDGTCIFTEKDIEDYTEIDWGYDLASSEEVLVASVGGKLARKTLKKLNNTT